MSKRLRYDLFKVVSRVGLPNPSQQWQPAEKISETTEDFESLRRQLEDIKNAFPAYIWEHGTDEAPAYGVILSNDAYKKLQGAADYVPPGMGFLPDNVEILDLSHLSLYELWTYFMKEYEQSCVKHDIVFNEAEYKRMHPPPADTGTAFCSDSDSD